VEFGFFFSSINTFILSDARWLQKKEHICCDCEDWKVVIRKELPFYILQKKNENGFQILNTILWHYLYVEGPFAKAIHWKIKMNGMID